MSGFSEKDIENIRQDCLIFDKINEEVSKHKHKLSILSGDLCDAEGKIEQLERIIKIKECAYVVIKKAIMLGTGRKQKVEALLSYGMSIVFGEEHQVKFDIEAKGKTMTVTPLLASKSDGGSFTKLRNTRGGGKINVYAFLVRTIALLSVRPKLRRFIVLDESFNNISSGNVERLCRMIEEFAQKMKIQTIIVTQNEALGYMDASLYKFSKVKGQTKVERIK